MGKENLQIKLKQARDDAAEVAKANDNIVDAKKDLASGLDDQKQLMLEASREETKKLKKGLSQRASLKVDEQIHKQELEITEPYFKAMQEVKKCEASRIEACISLANDLSASAGAESQEALDKLKGVLRAKVGQETLTDTEALNIDTAYEAIDNLEKNHPELKKVFNKLIKEETLSNDDYESVVKLLNPSEMLSATKVNPRGLEKMTSGLLIGFMDPDQRIKLVEIFMESGKKNQTGELIDVLLTLGRLSNSEAQELLKKAKDSGAITAAQYEQYIEQTNSDHYEKEQERYRLETKSQLQKDYKGKTNTNIVERFVGKPLLAFVGMCWGFTTFALNVAVNRRRGESIGTTIKRVSKSYALPGLAVGVLGLEATGSLLKSDGKELVGKGIIGELVSDNPADVRLAEIYKNGHPKLKAYLKNGGFNTIKKRWNETIRNKESRRIKIDDLITIEEDSDQRTRLELLKSESRAEDNINDKLTAVADSSKKLKITTNQEFQEKLTELTEE